MLKGQEHRISAINEFWTFFTGSYIHLVIIGFLALVVLNLGTYFFGSNVILGVLDHHYWGVIVAPFVFDSWGTIGGLLGVTILFAPILLGAPSKERKSLSIYFVSASITIGVVSNLIWNSVFNLAKTFPFGASSIDIAAQAIIFTFSIFGLFDTLYRNPHSDRYIRNSFAIIYATLIATTLWFILFLEPIFIASDQYNWRVHEIAFIIGMLITVIYTVIRFLTQRKEKQLESSVIQNN